MPHLPQTENLIATVGRTKSLPNVDATTPLSNALPGPLLAAPHQGEAENVASRKSSLDLLTGLNLSVLSDPHDDCGEPGVDPLETSVRSLPELTALAQESEKNGTELLDQTHPFLTVDPSATENPFCLPPALQDSKLSPVDKVCDPQQEPDEKDSKLDIYFDKKTFQSADFQEVLSTMAGSLRDLTIDVPGCELTQKDIDTIGFEVGFQRSSITKFSFAMPNYNKDFELSFTPVLNALIKATELTDLKLDLRSSGFLAQDKTLSGIAEILKSHPKLKQMVLAVQNNVFSKSAISAFSRDLAQLKELESVSLNFSQSRHIDAEVFSNFFTNLRELTSLRNLQLSVHYNNDLNENTVSCLCGALRELPNIEEFGLYVRGGDVDAGAIRAILDATQAWKNLQKLHIDACNSARLDDEEVRPVIAAFATQRKVGATIYMTQDDVKKNNRNVAALVAADLERRGHKLPRAVPQ
ncbi:leucine-rich repeat domain-containing protein [Pandoraea sputorum]|uniref:hypothetical protein n=1 Tax=Pandoraea sputorum TaxID=93222 RepID=UPI00123FEAE3|nr:hypothetical protein [Pandoraea sputorum]